MTDLLERAKEPLDPNARMQGYYIGFDRTGVGVVDKVLSELAYAGKAYHHTSDWTDEYDEKYFPNWEDRRSHEQRIQDAATDAAKLFLELVMEIELLRRDLVSVEYIESVAQEISEEYRPAYDAIMNARFGK